MKELDMRSLIESIEYGFKGVCPFVGRSYRVENREECRYKTYVGVGDTEDIAVNKMINEIYSDTHMHQYLYWRMYPELGKFQPTKEVWSDEGDLLLEPTGPEQYQCYCRLYASDEKITKEI